MIFPQSIPEWYDEDEELQVKRKQHIHARMASMRFLGRGFPSNSSSMFGGLSSPWHWEVKATNDQESFANPFRLLENTLEEAFLHWNTYLDLVSKAVNRLSGPDVYYSRAERDVCPEQQIQAVVLHGAARLAEILVTIKYTIEISSKSGRKGIENPFYMGKDYAESFELPRLYEEYSLLKTQLERHLPTLQHLIDIVIQRQQFRLAEFQLQESRRGIQQADTITRLTMLAFIYIPAQFAASIFGMNKELLGTEPTLWTFVSTTIVLLVITMSAAVWRHIWESARDKYGRLHEYVRHLVSRKGRSSDKRDQQDAV